MCFDDSHSHDDEVGDEKRGEHEDGVEYFGVLDLVSSADHDEVHKSNENQAADDW